MIEGKDTTEHCETCRWLSRSDGWTWGYCRYVLPYWVPVHFNSAARRLDDGNECPTWEAKP